MSNSIIKDTFGDRESFLLEPGEKLFVTKEVYVRNGRPACDEVPIENNGRMFVGGESFSRVYTGNDKLSVPVETVLTDTKEKYVVVKAFRRSSISLNLRTDSREDEFRKRGITP